MGVDLANRSSVNSISFRATFANREIFYG